MLKFGRTRGYITSFLRPLVESKTGISSWNYNHHKQLHDDSSNNSNSGRKSDNKSEPTAVTSKFEVFREDDATVILDVEEERERIKLGIVVEETTPDPFEGLNLKRKWTQHISCANQNSFIYMIARPSLPGGKTGVYEIDDLVQVLQRDNAQDIFVCRVAKKWKYVDYIVVTHGRSFKHMEAMAEFVRKMYKKKKSERDTYPKIEGANSQDWMAVDLGNIALHIFSKTARQRFDLESLWSVGPAYDRETTKKVEDDVLDLFERHSVFLQDLSSFKRKGSKKEADDEDDSTPFDAPIESESKLK